MNRLLTNKTSQRKTRRKLGTDHVFPLKRFFRKPWSVPYFFATASGVAAQANGGSFGQGFWVAAVTNAAALVYKSTVGYDENMALGRNPEYPFYQPEADGRQPASTFEDNVTGFNYPGYVFSQGGVLSKILNLLPFVNSSAGYHGYYFNSDRVDINILTNIGTMIPAAAISTPASINNPSFGWILHNKPRTPDKDKKPCPLD